MDRSASQCTTESGWTHYLEPSTSTTLYPDQQHQHLLGDSLQTVYDQEEDLSMVSDASSAPPICHQHYDQGTFCANGSCNFNINMNKNNFTHQSATKLTRSCLEDTASSPVFTFSKKNMSFTSKKPSMEHNVSSDGFSATHFKRNEGVEAKGIEQWIHVFMEIMIGI